LDICKDKQGGNVSFKSMIYLLVFTAISANYSYANEILHPANNDIHIEYTLSATNLNVGDTLIITRSLVNNSSDTLNNLYWVDNFPPELNILTYGVYLNGVEISNFCSGPVESWLYNSYNTVRWVVDLPSGDDPYNHKISPSDSIALVYFIICENQGNFVLPFHTTCFHNGDHGSYTAGESITIEISYQSSTGNIAGMVTDNNLNPVHDAEIVVIETGAIRYSSGEGLYSFSDLQPGIYSLSVTHPEYRDIIETDIQVYANQTTNRDIVIYSSDLLYVPGDINGDGAVIGNDVTYAINYFRGVGSSPPDSVWLESSQRWLFAAADVNGSCSFIGSDVTYLINFFRSVYDEILYCPEVPPQ